MVRITNLELVRLLWENSRMSFVDMARHFGVSETAVRKRTRKLIEDGIIRKYTVEINPRKLGFNVNAVIGVDTEPEHYLRTLEALKGTDEVRGLCSSSGDHMMMAECWFRNSSDLARFIKKIESMEGVKRTCPAIINERIK